jgi:hypothetical protein
MKGDQRVNVKLERVQTGLGPVATLNREEARELMDLLLEDPERIWEIKFAIDGGLKIKLNGLSWSAAVGVVDGEKKG